MAGLRAFLFVQRHLVKAKTNPMWKEYLRRNSLDRETEQDYLVLRESISEYTLLYDKYEINRPTELDRAKLAAHVGLSLPDK
jgi:hypothetical protein